jgi:hypothetical protein
MAKPLAGKLRPKLFHSTYVRHEFFSFFLPDFPGAPGSERPLLPSERLYGRDL